MITWHPGYVYPPVFNPPHLPLDVPNAIFFALVALIVGVATIRRPALGVGALILCIPFADARYIGGGATSVTVPKAALVGYFVALVMQRPSLALLRDGRVRLIVYAFAAVIAAIVLSGVGAHYPDAVARELGKWLEYLITFGAAAIAFANDPDDRPIWRALIVIAYVEAALGVLQLLTGAPSGVVVRGHVFPRIAGSLEGPNQFSGWLNLIVPVLFARVLVHRDWWLVGALVVSLAVELATLSRAGIVATVVALVLVVVVTRPPRRIGFRYAIAGASIAVIVVLLGIGIGLEARFFSFQEVAQPDHLGTRGILWSAALDLWKLAPLTGIGAGNYERELGMVGHPDVHTHANSAYLQALAETGLAGLAAVLFLIYASLAPFARSFSRRPLVTGVFAANVGMALHQIFDYLWFFPKVGSFWALLLGVAIVEVIAARDDIDALPEAV